MRIHLSRSSPAKMGDLQCYEPSSLITSIHERVPFLTDAGSEDNSAELVLKLDESTKEFYDIFVVSDTKQNARYLFHTLTYCCRQLAECIYNCFIAPVITMQLLYTEIECSSTPCPAASDWVVATLHNCIMMFMCTLHTLINIKYSCNCNTRLCQGACDYEEQFGTVSEQ